MISTKPICSTKRVSSSSKICVTVFATVTTLVIFCICYVDVPLAAWVKHCPEHRVIHEILDIAEPFGTPYGQLLAFLLIATLDSPRRNDIPRLATAAWSAGIVGNLTKLCVPRTRPDSFDFSSTVTDCGFLEFMSRTYSGSSVQSFPSAHTSCAVAFSVVLCQMYPKGRTLFVCLAVLVGVNRIETASHFASDVCAGAFIGWIIGRVFAANDPLFHYPICTHVNQTVYKSC
ncbi:phosphatase PAP2 family protein [Planctomicrobium sp. SH527]|uniref:phosphatase PAP2 family protein n=1 Tax=Planctomicrobium sp. SH527 TaxID=3448123 RepID=UPI003F5C0539